MDCVVSPVDQRLSVADDEVSTTEPPAQKVVAELAVIAGVAGTAFIVIVVLAETPEAQPEAMTSTEKLPEVVTVIDCVVSPVDQMLSVAEEDVRMTDPPSQKVVAPPGVIEAVRTAFSVTTTAADVAVQSPVLIVTE